MLVVMATVGLLRVFVLGFVMMPCFGRYFVVITVVLDWLCCGMVLVYYSSDGLIATAGLLCAVAFLWCWLIALIWLLFSIWLWVVFLCKVDG